MCIFKLNKCDPLINLSQTLLIKIMQFLKTNQKFTSEHTKMYFNDNIINY